jgi:putative membrane protein
MAIVPTSNTTLLSLIKRPIFWAVFICALVHVSGAIGMVFFNRQAFLELTAVNLLLMFTLLYWIEERITAPLVYSFVVIFITGVVTEIIGVNTGLLFGAYVYGDFFGPKFLGVPLVIGINWFCIVYCSFVVVAKWMNTCRHSFFLIPLLSSLLATAFDWVMEPAAVALNFWTWEGGHIPFLNYASWFGLTFLLVCVMRFLKTPASNQFAIFLLLIQAFFFIFLRISL